MKHTPTKRNNETLSDRLIKLVRRVGILRSRDLSEEQIPRIYLTRLVESGILERSSRGIYVLAESDITEHHSLAEACRRVPHGVICLLSALQFHGMTRQAPYKVWMAISRKARLPKQDNPLLRIVRFSRNDLTRGVQVHNIEGVDVKVTTPARTIADCFAYRNTIGIDVALESLRDGLRQKFVTPDELYHAAKARHMANVMRPYLEATIS